MDMTPTGDQEKALDEINEWFRNDSTQIFRLGGLAGTGKSSLIPWVHERLGLEVQNVQYVAPTNKAALVVQRRLDSSGIKTNARTVHKTYYTKAERHCDKCPLTESLRNICHGVSGSNSCGCYLDFNAKMASDDKIQLVICDESSMIGREVHDDLITNCGRDVKILFVGDHGQLEAVEDNYKLVKTLGKFSLMDKPNYVLEEIQRQAKGSNILKLAYLARQGRHIDFGQYGPEAKKVKLDDELDFDFKDANLIGITYFSNVDPQNKYHKGRIAVDDLNKMWRYNLGIASSKSDKPVVGDRVVCRDYIRSQTITKGTLGKITEIKYNNSDSWYATILLDDGRYYEGVISSEQFYQNKPIWGRTHLDKWDYGYALTCHTAQGSEFDSVVVFEPPLAFIKWLGRESYSRWLYTAITRAKRHLLLVG